MWRTTPWPERWPRRARRRGDLLASFRIGIRIGPELRNSTSAASFQLGKSWFCVFGIVPPYIFSNDISSLLHAKLYGMLPKIICSVYDAEFLVSRMLRSATQVVRMTCVCHMYVCMYVCKKFSDQYNTPSRPPFPCSEARQYTASFSSLNDCVCSFERQECHTTHIFKLWMDSIQYLPFLMERLLEIVASTVIQQSSYLELYRPNTQQLHYKLSSSCPAPTMNI